MDVQIFDDMSLSDPMVIGIANTVLVEVAKRLPQIPLDPGNPDQVKFVSASLLFILAVCEMAIAGTLNFGDLKGSAKALVKLWCMGWIISHTAYQAIPGMKQKTVPAGVVPSVQP